MTVRGKFFVAEVRKRPGKGGVVQLSAASRGARNATWASASPSGTIELTINNPDAFAFFEQILDGAGVDKHGYSHYPEVFVDFTPCYDGYPGDGHDFELADVPEGHYCHGKCAACGQPEGDHT